MKAKVSSLKSAATVAPSPRAAPSACAPPAAEIYAGIFGLTDPREPLPELLRRCLELVGAGKSPAEPGALIEIIKVCLASASGSRSQDDWRRMIWLGPSDPQTTPIAATCVRFDNRRRLPLAETAAAAVIFGRSLKLVWVAAPSGRCGHRIFGPDGSQAGEEYGQHEVPDWLNAELGRPDRVWSKGWGTHVPSLGSFHPRWSEALGWR